jgi:hypothetical protein
LPSNVINDIDINTTGEVFIAKAKARFKGIATASEDLTNAYVYQTQFT